MTEIISVQGLPFLACLAMVAILSYIGIHVLKREVIFIDIALAQIAAVGAIAGQVVFHLHDQPVQAYALSLGATLIAAAFFAVVRKRIVEIPLEAVIGVSYAVSAAAALFLVGVSPGGHVHVQEMLSGSILWATWSDVVLNAVIFSAVGVCFFVFRKPLRVISDDYDDAVRLGYNTIAWDFLFYALVGVVITTAVRTAGVVVVFTFLIIPATLSAALATGWTLRLVIAWAAGGVAAAVGLLFAERFDFSVGPAIGLFLGAGLILVGILRAARTPRVVTVVVSLAAAAVLGGGLVSGTLTTMPVAKRVTRAEPQNAEPRRAEPQGTDSQSAEYQEQEMDARNRSDARIQTREKKMENHSHARTHTHGHKHHLSEGVHQQPTDRQGIDENMLAAVSGVSRLMSLFDEAVDPEERSLVVSRLLEVDLHSGAGLAIEFLAEDPPLLFRLTVVDKLEEILGVPVDYRIDEPFESAANQRAAAGLTKTAGLE